MSGRASVQRVAQTRLDAEHEVLALCPHPVGGAGLEQLLDLPVRPDGNYFRAGETCERIVGACAPERVRIDGLLHVNFLEIYLHLE